MPRRSTVLDAPHRATIDALLLAGERDVKDIAAEFQTSYPALKRYARRLRSGDAKPSSHASPGTLTATETFERAVGFPAMAHQRKYLEETRPTLVLKGRQTGLTASAAALAVHTARTKPGSTSVIISPSLRQSSEVTGRARIALWEWGEQLKQDSVSLLRTAAGSRIISLPGSARGIRGYACQLVVLDEAAWINDETWAAARPLVSATGGRICVASTPGLPSGFFYEMATNTPDGWAFIKIRSSEVSIIDPAFLEKERGSMVPELYAQEYEAEFASTLGGSLFSADRIASLILPEEPRIA